MQRPHPRASHPLLPSSLPLLPLPTRASLLPPRPLASLVGGPSPRVPSRHQAKGRRQRREQRQREATSRDPVPSSPARAAAARNANANANANASGPARANTNPNAGENAALSGLGQGAARGLEGEEDLPGTFLDWEPACSRNLPTLGDTTSLSVRACPRHTARGRVTPGYTTRGCPCRNAGGCPLCCSRAWRGRSAEGRSLGGSVARRGRWCSRLCAPGARFRRRQRQQLRIHRHSGTSVLRQQPGTR